MNEKAKQVLENIKNIKVGSMVLNDLFGGDLKIIETALNDYEEEKKELVAEQHRLFDLAKEQENELKELKEFVKIVATKVQAKGFKNDYWIDIGENNSLSKNEFELVRNVVDNYGKKED